MTVARGYFINIGDTPIPFPIQENWDGDTRALVESDLRHDFQSGARIVYKRATQRRWRLPFVFTEQAHYDFFQTLHRSANLPMSKNGPQLYFVEDINSSPLEYFLVTKERNYRPVRHASPLAGGTPIWNYMLEMLEVPAAVQLGFAQTSLEIYECPNGNGTIDNSANLADNSLLTYATMGRFHYGVFATARFLRVKIPYVALGAGEKLTITSYLEYIPGDFAVAYQITISDQQHDTSSDSGPNNFWVPGHVGGTINEQNTGTSPWSGTKTYQFVGGVNDMPGDVYVYYWTGTSLYEGCFPTCSAEDNLANTNTLKIFKVRATIS